MRLMKGFRKPRQLTATPKLKTAKEDNQQDGIRQVAPFDNGNTDQNQGRGNVEPVERRAEKFFRSELGHCGTTCWGGDARLGWVVKHVGWPADRIEASRGSGMTARAVPPPAIAPAVTPRAS